MIKIEHGKKNLDLLVMTSVFPPPEVVCLALNRREERKEVESLGLDTLLRGLE